jgi:hypothetical protein
MSPSFLSLQPCYYVTGGLQNLGVVQHVVYLQPNVRKDHQRTIRYGSYLVILLHCIPLNPLFIFPEELRFKSLLVSWTSNNLGCCTSQPWYNDKLHCQVWHVQLSSSLSSGIHVRHAQISSCLGLPHQLAICLYCQLMPCEANPMFKG